MRLFQRVRTAAGARSWRTGVEARHALGARLSGTHTHFASAALAGVTHISSNCGAGVRRQSRRPAARGVLRGARSKLGTGYVRCSAAHASSCLTAPLRSGAACESMLDSAGSVVAGARTPTDGEWTSAQYDAVLSAVARSPHGAVSVSTLLRAMPPPPPGCGGADAAAALAALQARDLIFRRSRDGMTHDLHPDAFDPVSREDVFVLASAAHLRIAKQLVEAEELGAENE